jgi:hypothetical protein
MTGTGTCREARPELGVYVPGAPYVPRMAAAAAVNPIAGAGAVTACGRYKAVPCWTTPGDHAQAGGSVTE